MKLERMNTKSEQQQESLTLKEESPNNSDYSEVTQVEYEHVTNTPFIILKKDGLYVICVGLNIVSEKEFKTTETARKYINSKPWDLIINATTLINKLNQER